jgi:hypothetical protein
VSADTNADQLVTDHLRFANRIAGVYIRKGVAEATPLIDQDDIRACVHEALVKAALAYKPEIGSFRAYAVIRMHKAVLDLQRASDHLKRRARDNLKRRAAFPGRRRSLPPLLPVPRRVGRSDKASHQHAGFSLMGRAGIEPATLGLKDRGSHIAPVWIT